MMDVNVFNGILSAKEIEAYKFYGKEKYPNKIISGMDINVDGDYVDVQYYFADVPFQRIRRITGYLVGTVDRFNDAKRTEVRDRVKHNVC